MADSRRFPDIVLTGPHARMDGLELSGKDPGAFPAPPKIIFISGYEDFACTKKAISLEPTGMLTEPVIG